MTTDAAHKHACRIKTGNSQRPRAKFLPKKGAAIKWSLLRRHPPCRPESRTKDAPLRADWRPRCRRRAGAPFALSEQSGAEPGEPPQLENPPHSSDPPRRWVPPARRVRYPSRWSQACAVPQQQRTGCFPAQPSSPPHRFRPVCARRWQPPGSSQFAPPPRSCWR